MVRANASGHEGTPGLRKVVLIADRHPRSGLSEHLVAATETSRASSGEALGGGCSARW